MNIKATLKRISQWFTLTVIVLVLFTGLFFALAQTKIGKHCLSRWLESTLSDGAKRQITIGRISGYVPFNIQWDRIAISDEAGDWLIIENALFNWKPSLGVKGWIFVHELSAEKVYLACLPRASTEKETKKLTLPRWPPHVPLFQIERFNVKSLHIGKAILGVDALFAIKASMVSNSLSDGLEGTLRMDRTDKPGAFIEMNWSFVGKKPLFAFDAIVREDEEGLVKTILGKKETGPVFFRLTGEGPADQWKGRLTAQAEKLARIESTIKVWARKDLKIMGDGDMMLHPSIVPQALSPLIQTQAIQFALDMEYGDTKKPILYHGFLDAGSSDIKIRGGFDLNKQRIDATFNLGIKDIALLRENLGDEVKGSLSAKGVLSGSLRRPLVKISIVLLNPEYGNLGAREITSEIEMRTLGKFFTLSQGLQTRGKGSIKGLWAKEKSFPLPVKQFQWNFDAGLKKGNPLSINEFEVTAENFRLRFTGVIDPAIPIIHGKALLDSDDINALSDIFGADLAGRACLSANLRADLQTRHLFAAIEGTFNDMESLPFFWVPILEGGITFNGKMEIKDGRFLSFSDCNIKSAAAEMTGNSLVDLFNKHLTAKARVLLPALNVFSKTTQKELQGVLKLDLDAAGPYTNPAVTVTATGKEVVMESFRLQELLLSFHAENLPVKPHGTCKLFVKQADHIMNATTEFTLNNQNLNLEEIVFVGAGARLTGNLELDFKRFIMQGSLNGKFDDLTSLSPLMGERIEGSAGIDALFTGGDKGQDLALKVHGKDWAIRFSHVNELTIDAHIRDLFGNMKGKAGFALKSLQQGPLNFQTLYLEAEGQPEKVSFLLKGSGSYPDRFEVQTRGFCQFSDKKALFRLDHLQGCLGKYPVSLQQPLIVRRLSHKYIFENTFLSLGQGTVRSSAMIGSKSMALDTLLDGIPLEILSLFGLPGLTGSATAKINIEGPFDRPQGDVEIRIRQIQSKEGGLQNIPPADLSAKASLKKDLLQGNLVIEGLSIKPSIAVFQFPVFVSLSPISFSLGQKGAIQGRVSSELKIKRFLSFFDLEDQVLDGDLIVDLTVTGSLEEPELKGSLSLSSGVYENAKSGIFIKEIQVNITAVDDRLVIDAAHAKDLKNGSIQAKGWLLVANKNFSYSLDLNLRNTTLLRSDDLTLTTDADLTLSGSMPKTTLSGTFTVVDTEFNIPSRFPKEISELKVVEINAPIQINTGKPDVKQKPSGKLYLDLDIEAPGRIFVRGRGLDSEWKGKLHIMGDFRKPLITGNLSAIRGRYNFFGKPFSLSRGVFYFDGDSLSSSRFDVSGEHRHSNMTTRIRVSGSPAAPGFQIESDPPTASDEILARLFFGKEVANLTPFQALRLAQAVNTLRGGGSSMLDFFERTHKFLGVDQLDIIQSGDNNRQTVVSAGKYIRENVYVTMEKGLAAESGKVSVEVELTPNITLESEAGADSQGKIGINRKYDY